MYASSASSSNPQPPTPTHNTNIVIRPLELCDIPACVDLLNKYLSFGRTTDERLLKFLGNSEIIAYVLVQITNEDQQKVIGFVKCQILPTLYGSPQQPDNKNGVFPLAGVLDELGYKPTAIEFLSQQLTDPTSRLYHRRINLISLDLIVIDPDVRGGGYFHQLRQRCLDSYQPKCSDTESPASQLLQGEQSQAKFMIGYSWLRSEELGKQLAKSSLATMVIPEYWSDENAPCDLCGAPCRCGVAVFIKH